MNLDDDATSAVGLVDMEGAADGTSYTDLHTLLNAEGRWKVIAKVFHQYEPGHRSQGEPPPPPCDRPNPMPEVSPQRPSRVVEGACSLGHTTNPYGQTRVGLLRR